MPESIGDILSGGGFTEAVQQAATEVAKPVETQAEPQQTTEPQQTEQKPTPATVVTENKPDPAVEYLKRFGFEKEEDLKSSLTELETLRQSISDFDQKRNYYAEMEKEYEELAQKNDVRAFFESEDEYKNFLVAQKLGKDKDFGVVQKIIRSNLDQLDDLDVLSLKDQYEIPRYAGKDDKVKKALLEELGVDVSDPDFKLENYKDVLTEDQDLKLARMAKQARDIFNTAKAGVDVPQLADPKVKLQEKIKQREERLSQLVQSWKDHTDRVVESSTQIKFFEKNDKGEEVVDFVYDVDAEFKESIPEIVSNFVLQNGVEPTQENVKMVTDRLMNAYWVANKDKLYKAIRNDAQSKLREQLDKERYNGQPINRNEAPPERTPDANDEVNQIANRLAGLK